MLSTFSFSITALPQTRLLLLSLFPVILPFFPPDVFSQTTESIKQPQGIYHS